MILKVFALPVLLIMKSVCVLGNLLSNISSYVVGDLEIANILEASDFENAATALLEQSLDNGGKDNISLIMIAVEEDA